MDENTLALYDPRRRTIYMIEEAEYNRRWISHSNIEYTLKHEVGHAFNDLLLNDKLISDGKAFREAYNNDVARLSGRQFRDLRLPNKEHWQDRDEVFARLYAYASGLSSSHDKSYKIGQYFPECLNYIREFE